MPLYNYECPKCKAVVEEFVFKRDEVCKCEKCKVKMKRMPVLTMAGVKQFPEDGVYLEHVSPQGKLFKSKSEMRQYANTHNLSLGYLL